MEKWECFDEIPEIYVILPPLGYMGHGVHFHLNQKNWLSFENFETHGCVKQLTENTWSVCIFEPSLRKGHLPDSIIHSIYKKTESDWISAGYNVLYFSSQVITSEFIRQEFLEELKRQERILSTINF